MNNQNLENRIRENFLTLAPNQFDETMEAFRNQQAALYADKNILPAKPKVAWGRMLAAAAALVVCITSFGGMQLHRANRTYTVAIDVNPGVALTVDRKYCVEEVHGTNDDGMMLLDELDMQKGMEIGEAVDEIILAMVEKEYIHDGSAVLITSEKSDNKKSAKLRSVVEEEVRKDIELCGVQEVTLASRSADVKQYGSGKEALASELVEKGVLSKQDVEALSVGDLISYSDQVENTAVECVSGDKNLVRKPDNETQPSTNKSEAPSQKEQKAEAAEQTAKASKSAKPANTPQKTAQASVLPSSANDAQVAVTPSAQDTASNDLNKPVGHKLNISGSDKPTNPAASQTPDDTQETPVKPSSTPQVTETPKPSDAGSATEQPKPTANKIKDKTQPTSKVDSDNTITQTEPTSSPTPEQEPAPEQTAAPESQPATVPEQSTGMETTE